MPPCGVCAAIAIASLIVGNPSVDACGLRELLARREVSSRELVGSCLERIERLDGRLRAFRVVTEARALADADAADRALREGDRRALLGVPVAVKDVVDVAGETTSLGTGAVTRRAQADGELVRRLAAAGAVLIGKTNLSELQIWALTASATSGVTRNPWNTERSAGGTSGGSAVAVAAGMTALAHGVDGGGSIRLPAAWCGLVGFKPAPDRDVRTRESWHGLAVHGPLARSVRDAALLAAVLAGDLRPDANTVVATARRPPGRLRIAITVSPPTPAPVDAPVRDAVFATARVLEALGHRVEQRNVFGGLGDAQRVGLAILARFLDGARAEAARLERPERLEPRTRAVLRAGRLVPERALRAAQRAQADEQRRLAAALAGVDALLMPVSARIALRADAWDGLGAIRAFGRQSRLIPFTPPWNLVGWPALALPAAHDPNGVPIGVQLIAAPGRAPALFALAAQLQSAQPRTTRSRHLAD
jgi:amidase